MSNGAISLSGVSKRFGTLTAVDRIDLNVPKHSVFGLLGPNGAGKTTTIRMLVGLSKPDAGTITIAGSPVRFGGGETGKSLGYLPEQPAFYPWMRGSEYMDFVTRLYQLPDESRAKRCTQALSEVGLQSAAKKRIGGYSNGMRQRLGIAQAIVHRPPVIIMDEPVSALDPIGRREIMNLIASLKKESTVLLSTHVLSDVDRLCDEVAIMKEGRVLVQSPLAELKASFAKPVVRVEFDRDPAPFLDTIQTEPWVREIRQEGTSLRITTHGESGNTALRFLSALPADIIRFEQALPETEDLFIDLVS